MFYLIAIGSQRLDKLQAEYDLQRNALLENWDKEETYIIDTQDKAELKLKLVTYINNRDFEEHNKKKEMERATAKNDARLEVGAIAFQFIFNYFCVPTLYVF